MLMSVHSKFNAVNKNITTTILPIEFLIQIRTRNAFLFQASKSHREARKTCTFCTKIYRSARYFHAKKVLMQNTLINQEQIKSKINIEIQSGNVACPFSECHSLNLIVSSIGMTPKKTPDWNIEWNIHLHTLLYLRLRRPNIVFGSIHKHRWRRRTG